MTRNEFRAQAIALPRDSVDSVLATNKVIRNTYPSYRNRTSLHDNKIP